MIICIVQARLSSTRLPGKVLKPILGEPMLLRQIERVLRAKKINKLLVATSVEKNDDQIARVCEANQIACFRGHLQDVLDRYYQAAQFFSPQHVVRITGDCPLIDPKIIDQVIESHLQGDFDYTNNTLEPTYPDGLDVEVMRFSALQAAWQQARLPSQREHVTSFLYSQPEKFKINQVKNSLDYSHLRWTVDEEIDFELVKKIYGSLYEENPMFGFQDILDYLNLHPELKTLNTQHQRNAGLQQSLKVDQTFLQENIYEK